MRVLETDRRLTEILLTVQEKTVLQKASRLVARLAKFHGGEDEKKAAEIMVPMAAKWAPEPKTQAKTEEKKDAAK
jgi:hypothetical protein